MGPIDIPLVWPAKDGYVAMTFLFGSALGVFTAKLMHYICEQGFCDEATRDKDWIAYGEQLFSGAEPLVRIRARQEVVEISRAATPRPNCSQLAVEHGFLITPVSTIEEVVESPQFESRDYFQTSSIPNWARRFATRDRSRNSARRRFNIAVGRRQSASTIAKFTATNSG